MEQLDRRRGSNHVVGCGALSIVGHRLSGDDRKGGAEALPAGVDQVAERRFKERVADVDACSQRLFDTFQVACEGRSCKERVNAHR